MVPLRLACAIRDAELAAAVQCCLRALPVRIVLDQHDLQSFARQLRGVRPDVALIEVGEAGEPGELGRTRQVRAPTAPWSSSSTGPPTPPPSSPRSAPAPTNSSTRRSKITCGMRSSASPTGSAGARKPAGPSGKILAFASVKGGCGATTLACATAMELARHDQRGVALLDLDFSVQPGRVPYRRPLRLLRRRRHLQPPPPGPRLLERPGFKGPGGH